jgi:hypothetical protein
MRSDIAVVQSYIDSMVGIKKFSYPARQDAKKPDGEFAHISLLEEYPVGIPNQVLIAQDDITTSYRYYSPTRLRFRIGMVETSGMASIKIMHGWTSEAMKSLMMVSGYGFIKCTPISLEDGKLESFWEARQGFSLELYSTRVYDEVVSNINTVKVSGAFYTDSLDEYLMNFEINK